jgi:hypothetical protein
VERIDETGSSAHTIPRASRTSPGRGSLREALHPRRTCEPTATTTIMEGSEVKPSLGMLDRIDGETDPLFDKNGLAQRHGAASSPTLLSLSISIMTEDMVHKVVDDDKLQTQHVENITPDNLAIGQKHLAGAQLCQLELKPWWRSYGMTEEDRAVAVSWTIEWRSSSQLLFSGQ